jgi:trimeric autotransporter adhesin
VEHLLVRPLHPSKNAFPFSENKMQQSADLPSRFAWLCLFLCAFSVSAAAQTKTATTTALAVTSSSSAVTTIAIGAPITLTASVSAGTTAIKTGQVEFCDATAPHCTDIHVLGLAQLTTAGTASVTLRPPVGAHQYKAVFVGTTAYATSASSSSALSVTGVYPSVTNITPTGAAGNYTLTATVSASARSLPGPTGSVSFIDTTSNNAVLAQAALGTPTLAPSLVNVSNPTLSYNYAPGTLAGDFNNDGLLDLAIAGGANGQTVTIMLGDGKGNFTPVTTGSITISGSPVLTADFNGDGFPDILMTSDAVGNQLVILLGNGDGTFNVPPGNPMPSNYGNYPVVVADLNGDGIPDIAAAGGYYMVVWLGNGDGTFTQMPINSSSLEIDDEVASMVVGDFNGDGIPDLAALGDPFQTKISIYLGKGDGTFQQGSTFPISPSPVSDGGGVLATADFNGDGKLDLVAPLYVSGGVQVFLGNGDGTFQAEAQGPITTPIYTNSVAVGDFNGDGVPDLVASFPSSSTDTEIFLGKGDGTFAPTPAESAALPCCGTVLADFNGDGVTDIVSTIQGLNSMQVLFGETIQSAATVTGIAPSGGAAMHLVDASYPGDTSFGPSTSSTTSLQVQAAAPVFTPVPGTYPSTQTVSISDSSTSVTIWYTTDGSTPQQYESLSYEGPITVSASETIKAIAAGSEYAPSPVTTAVYAIVPPPQLTSFSPSFTSAAGAAFTLTLNGTGFASTSTVNFGSTAVPTQYVSPTQLTAQVGAAQIATPGVVAVTVQNPTAAGGPSNTLHFEVDSAGTNTPPNFTSTTATVAAGSTATYAVILPSSATNVSVTCLNLPAGASCSYTASPSTLTITTTSATPAGTFPVTVVFTETLPGAAPALIALPLLLLPFAGIARKRVKPGALWMVCLGIALTLGAIAGCGGSGGGGGTTPQTHEVTSSATVTLIVQ